jgi:hypothetical protein
MASSKDLNWFKNKVVRRISGLRKEEVTEDEVTQ